MPYKLVNTELMSEVSIATFDSACSTCQSLVFTHDVGEDIQVDTLIDSVAKFPVLGAALYMLAQGKPVLVGIKVRTATAVGDREQLAKALSYYIEHGEAFINHIMYNNTGFRLTCAIHTLAAMRRFVSVMLSIAVERSNVEIIRIDQVGK